MIRLLSGLIQFIIGVALRARKNPIATFTAAGKIIDKTSPATRGVLRSIKGRNKRFELIKEVVSQGMPVAII